MAPSSTSPSLIAAAIQKVRSRLQAASMAILSERQATSVKDVPKRASSLVSKTLLPAPAEDDARQALFDTVKQLGSGSQILEWPKTVDVEVEWTKSENPKCQPTNGPVLSEEDGFARSAESISHQVVILYLHGGAF